MNLEIEYSIFIYFMSRDTVDYMISRYAHPFEKRVDRFFSTVRSSGSSGKIHERISRLMQENLIVLNLWMERRFKRYTSLTRSRRKVLYTYAERIAEEFDLFAQTHNTPPEHIQAIFQQWGLQLSPEHIPRVQHMAAIMAFLKPGERYTYIKSASFDKLLCDITQSQMRGDCNQIVTLYTFLYGRKFPMDELQLKLLPDHVCLHLFGVDVEATNATFQQYTEYEYIAPVSELLSVNLLDVTDMRENTGNISPKNVAQAAKLAYHLSSNRDIVERNLRSAYHNLALLFAKQKNFKSAVYYAKTSKNTQLLKNTNHNAAVHFIEKKNYTKALYFAEQTGNQKLINSVYQQEYSAIQKKIPKNLRTVEQHKKYVTTYKRLLTLAKKAGMREQEQQLRTLLSQLK